MQLYIDQSFAAYTSIHSQFLSSTAWGPLFVGGVPGRLSPLLNGAAEKSFTGCIKELKMQQKLVQSSPIDGVNLLVSTGFMILETVSD